MGYGLEDLIPDPSQFIMISGLLAQKDLPHRPQWLQSRLLPFGRYSGSLIRLNLAAYTTSRDRRESQHRPDD